MALSIESPLVLGSRSPRRVDILRDLRVPFVVHPADADEAQHPDDEPPVYLERVVRAKLGAVRKSNPPEGEAVLVADTIVVIDGRIMGKPEDAGAALESLSSLAGRTHTVMTRYAIGAVVGTSGPMVARTVTSAVTMRAASREELRRYVDSGEGFDKAGAYAVQGLGAFLVERIEGSHTNVVGLPACELIQDLSAAGLLGPYP